MPEGHTIHRLARDHGRKFRGQVVTCVATRPLSEGAATIDQRELTDVFAHGKHLFYQFDRSGAERATAMCISVCLGDFARSLGMDKNPGRPRAGGLRHQKVDLICRGPLNVGCKAFRVEKVRAAIDQTLAENDDLRVLKKLADTIRSIAAVLMDQSVIAGVGNIYRSELLWFAKIDPFTPANTLDDNNKQSCGRRQGNG